MDSSEWYVRGREFLEEAQNAMNRKRFWLVCFDAHQAAEFFLKGKLLEKCGSFTFTHDLAVLVRELCACLSIQAPKEVLLAARFLTPHYTSSRYPGAKTIVYDEGLAMDCLDMARKIVEWVERI